MEFHASHHRSQPVIHKSSGAMSRANQEVVPVLCRAVCHGHASQDMVTARLHGSRQHGADVDVELIFCGACATFRPIESSGARFLKFYDPGVTR
eukprot:11184746-Lingulodinium_polyedra.AAC.1